MNAKTKIAAFFAVCAAACAVSATETGPVAFEKPYRFRAELERVHERGLRERSLKPGADDFVFRDGARISIPAESGEVLRNAARDFADYLFASMEVGAAIVCKRRAQVVVTIDGKLGARTSCITTTKDAVAIAASDERAAAQALYHLEDLMNLRRAPFLRCGKEKRTARFSPRMVHSGWGMDLIPENYLRRMVHYGYDALLVYARSVDKTKSSSKYEDIGAIIRRAASFGIDVYLYTSVKAYVHPDDPGAQEVFDRTYGEIARAYPEAKGIVLVGESCAFPSKDERACSDPFEVKQARGDKRPAPGWFPCRDYPDWLRCVKRAIGRHAPGMKVLFWTYNWSKDRTPEMPAARLALIDALPKEGTVLLSTFEMPEMVELSEEFSTAVSDYTVTCPGPGKVFASEEKKAVERGLELFTMCNTGGRTWDFGTAPFEPYPHQWAKRWSALRRANAEWGLSGLMESHHYGWMPNFVSELAKEAYTEGGLPFDEHLRMIAARDFGEANADEVVAIWKDWSEKGSRHPPTLGNQYGPFRIGPAYPFNFGGKRIERRDFPELHYAAYGIDICHLNFTEELWGERMCETEKVPAELKLLRPLAESFFSGAARMRHMSLSLKGRQAREAHRMSVLGEYLARVVNSAINLKRGAVAWEAKDDAALKEIAREELANARAALPLVDADSRLGFECSMEYTGGRKQIEWKMDRMRKLYGIEEEPAEATCEVPGLSPVERLECADHPPVGLVSLGLCRFAIVGDFAAERAVRGPEGQTLAKMKRDSLGRAAAILADAFEKCTGSRPCVLEAGDPRVAEYPAVIALGKTRWSKELGIDPDRLPREGFEVRTFPGGVVLAGMDGFSIPGFYDVFNWRCGRLTCNGTEQAAADFVERFLGYRRYSLWLGNDYEVAPKRDALSLPPLAYRDHPRQLFRAGHPNEGWRTATSTDWFGGEAPSPFDLAKAHPDKFETIFYRDGQGHLWQDPKVYGKNFLDVTNPELAKILVDDFRKYYAQNGTGTYWKSTWAPSSRYMWFGQCDRRVKIDNERARAHPRKDPYPTSDRYSEIYGHFYKHLSALAKEAFPDRRLVLMAYSNYLRAPRTTGAFPDNVQIMACIGTPALARSDSYMKDVLGCYCEWNALCAHKVVPYLYFLNYSADGGPIPMLMHGMFMGEFLKKTESHTDKGLYYPCFGHMGRKFPLAAHLTYRSAWNPDYDALAGARDYLENLFGPAAPPLVKFVERIRELWIERYIPAFAGGPYSGRNMRGIPQLQYDAFYTRMLTSSAVVELEALLAEAETLTRGDGRRMRLFKTFAEPYRKTFANAEAYRSIHVKSFGVGRSPTRLPPFHKAYLDDGKKVVSPDADMHWSDKGLTLSVRSPAPFKKGTHLWDADSFELFVAPGDEKPVNLYQFVFAANGQTEDIHEQLDPPRPGDPEWKAAGARCDVKSGEDAWTAELFIPWTAFYDAPPKAGDVWRMNLVSNRTTPAEYSSIAPTLNNNRTWSFYARVVFKED